MKENINYYIMLSDDNDYHQKRWYICTKQPLFGMSGVYIPGNRINHNWPPVLKNVRPPDPSNSYYLIADDIPHNTRNEGFRTKEEAKIALLLYIA